MEKPQRPSGPGLGGALCDQCRWKLDWEVKLVLSSGRAERGGGGKTAVGRVGRGSSGRVVGAMGAFRRTLWGIELLGLAWELGTGCLCVSSCACVIARVCWWFPLLMPAGSLLKAPSSRSKVSLLGPCLAVPHHLWRSWQDERGWSLTVAPSPPYSFGEIENGPSGLCSHPILT